MQGNNKRNKDMDKNKEVGVFDGIRVVSIPPYSLTVPKDKVTERELEPPTRKLFLIL